MGIGISAETRCFERPRLDFRVPLVTELTVQLQLLTQKLRSVQLGLSFSDYPQSQQEFTKMMPEVHEPFC